MTEQEKYEKFWVTFSEKLADILKEYNQLSDETKNRISQSAAAVFQLYGIAGLINFANNPPRL